MCLTFFIMRKPKGEATFRTKLTRKPGTKGRCGFRWAIADALTLCLPSAPRAATPVKILLWHHKVLRTLLQLISTILAPQHTWLRRSTL